MAKKNGVSKSEEIRQLLTANPELKAGEVVAKMHEKGIKVSDNLYYFVKGQMKGRKARKKRTDKMVAKVAETTGPVDALSTILKVKKLAAEVGGMKKVRALIEALCE
jgi:hypothetical protein